MLMYCLEWWLVEDASRIPISILNALDLAAYNVAAGSPECQKPRLVRAGLFGGV